MTSNILVCPRCFDRTTLGEVWSETRYRTIRFRIGDEGTRETEQVGPPEDQGSSEKSFECTACGWDEPLGRLSKLEVERLCVCGEPVVREDPDDDESWIHASYANDNADHTAEVNS